MRNRLLWMLQAVLAALFLFAGGAKLVMPIAAITKQIPVPGLLLRFVAVAEIAGALGLVLPGLTGIRPYLTPLAALGLMMIMSGAIGATLATGATTSALLPAGVGVLLAFVAYGRRVGGGSG